MLIKTTTYVKPAVTTKKLLSIQKIQTCCHIEISESWHKIWFEMKELYRVAERYIAGALKMCWRVWGGGSCRNKNK